MDDLLSGTALAERAARALAVPLVAALDVRLLDETDPTAGVWFEVADGIADTRTGRLGFATAAADGPAGPLARAQVTKSIVRFG